jgi:hypothetical protein
MGTVITELQRLITIFLLVVVVIIIIVVNVFVILHTFISTVAIIVIFIAQRL